MRRRTTLLFLSCLALTITNHVAAELAFQGQELPTRLKVGYAVRLLDMNDDQRLDIVIVDSKRILWLENPRWNEHVMIETPDAKYDNVSFAPYDIDGDGRLDFAVGADWQFNNTESGGTIGWITPGEQPTDLWQYFSIGEEPTVHRMNFADFNGDGRSELIVAPLKGRNTTGPDYQENGVRLLAFEIPEDPRTEAWKTTVINDQLHVTHNFWPVPAKGGVDLLVASFEGVTWLRRDAGGSWDSTHVGAGDQESSPNRGASEIKLGQLGGTSANDAYLATIEPCHGTQVVVYTPPAGANSDQMWNRHVLDNRLKWGHAVWCANLDDDADQELIIGVRDELSDDARRGLRIYDPIKPQSGRWSRHIIDPGSVAIEDLAAGDLNGDGRPEIVAVGRQTHNVKIYWNETK
jgi:hypothetical protein